MHFQDPSVSLKKKDTIDDVILAPQNSVTINGKTIPNCDESIRLELEKNLEFNAVNIEKDNNSFIGKFDQFWEI